jgi:tRNA pseudouridine38-40 synthase
MDPFQHNYSYHIRNHINVAAMQEAASYFVGVHNFSAFANHSADSASRDLLRELLRFTVSSTGAQVLFEVEGRSFMYKQVRNMVGLLIEVGKGLLPSSTVKTMLLRGDRRELARVSPVAPAHGLYLMAVDYDDKVLEPLRNAPQASFGRWLRHPQVKQALEAKL